MTVRYMFCTKIVKSQRQDFCRTKIINLGEWIYKCDGGSCDFFLRVGPGGGGEGNLNWDGAECVVCLGARGTGGRFFLLFLFLMIFRCLRQV